MRITPKSALVTLSTAVVLISLAVIIPNLANRPLSAPNNTCIMQLHEIDAAKQQWASVNHKPSGPVTWSDILPYLWRDPKSTDIPRCPKGGSYTLGSIGELPTCSIEGHKVP
ncbi:MAG: hypothetical protein NT154_36305 [Verrucomicrobia bacterium]|nr:hypothetical protein [Verrucomicrobiota bacterium]